MILLEYFPKISCKIPSSYLLWQGCGSQLWDAAFAVQAILSSMLVEEYGTTLRKAHEFIKLSQVLIIEAFQV